MEAQINYRKENRKHMKKIKEWILLIFLFIVFTITPGIIYRSILYMKEISGWVDNKEWIGFWGSIIGAVIGACVTLIGLIKTINHEKYLSNKNLELQVLPFFTFNISKVSTKCNNALFCTIYDDKDSINKILPENPDGVLIIKNLGLKLALDIDIEQKKINSHVTFDILPENSTYELLLFFERRNGTNERYTEHLIFRYKSLLGNYYMQNVKINYSYNITRATSDITVEYDKPEPINEYKKNTTYGGAPLSIRKFEVVVPTDNMIKS